jgi:ribosome maturation factor RimP
MTRQDIPLEHENYDNVVVLLSKKAFDKALPVRINQRRVGLTLEQWEKVHAEIDRRLDDALDLIWTDINDQIKKGTYFS